VNLLCRPINDEEAELRLPIIGWSRASVASSATSNILFVVRVNGTPLTNTF
jgi:hypothetical protein